MPELLNGSSDSSSQEEPPNKKWKKTTLSTTENNGKSNNGNTVNKQTNSSSSNNSSSNNGNAKTEKRTRPKRGRYRNYDRDNLAEAVRAVQRGEMSVHRAGSYYGVPHSTLEYKVKERHLLRPRKRDLRKEGNGEAAKGGKSGLGEKGSFGSSVNGVRTSNGEKGLNSSPFGSAASLSGLSFPAHIPIWQSSPFFSLDFSQFSPNHFFASQMMRKLQEDALMHAENSRPHSAGKEPSGVSLLNRIRPHGDDAGKVNGEAKKEKTEEVDEKVGVKQEND